MSEAVTIEATDTGDNVVITIDNVRVILACEESDFATELKTMIDQCSWLEIEHIGVSS